MKLYASIAWTAMAAALTVPAAAEAKARPHRHHAAAVSAQTEELRLAEQQIAMLTAQVSALQAKVDGQPAQTAATAQLAVQANAAAQQAAAASATAQTALAHADAAQKAAAHPAVPDAVKWAANTTVGGRMFFDASTITQKTNVATNPGGKNANTGTGFNVKRVYIQVDHKFNDVFSASLVTDISNVIGETATTNYVAPAANTTTGAISSQALVGKGFYVKNAFLQAKVNPALVIRAGAAPLPWVPYVEGYYGYRHIENVMIDRISYGTSADWGIHATGDLLGGHVSYAASAIDGGGYRNVKVTKHVDFEGRLSGQYDGFFAGIGGYIGKRANQTQFVESAAAVITPTTYRTAKRYDGLVGYKSKLFTVGGEYFYAKNWNNVTVNPATNAYSQDSASGWSAFGNFNVNPQWSVFGRYDWIKPNRITDAALRDHYMNVGLQWEPVKVVDLALVYKRETAENGAISTTDGVIGCGTSATANAFATGAAQIAGTCHGNGTYDEFGLFGQLKF